jgi:hypothetical protein
MVSEAMVKYKENRASKLEGDMEELESLFEILMDKSLTLSAMRTTS